MSPNPYLNYYSNQAGNGLSGFDGIRFQNGNGFFSNIFKSTLLPVLKYLGRNIATTGINVASDAIGGENVLNSLKSRSKQQAKVIADDASKRLTHFAQTGSGEKRRFKRKRVIKKLKNKKKIKRSKINYNNIF
jgi:hypothetical protein